MCRVLFSLFFIWIIVLMYFHQVMDFHNFNHLRSNYIDRKEVKHSNAYYEESPDSIFSQDQSDVFTSSENAEDSAYFSTQSTSAEENNIPSRIESINASLNNSHRHFLSKEVEETSVDSQLEDSNESQFSHIKEDLSYTLEETNQGENGYFDGPIMRDLHKLLDVSIEGYSDLTDFNMNSIIQEMNISEDGSQDWRSYSIVSNPENESVEDENIEAITIMESPQQIAFPYPKPNLRRKRHLKPSLEYYIAPIFPYYQKDRFNDEEKSQAKAIRNVVCRRFGRQFQEAISKVNHSLRGRRDAYSTDQDNKVKPDIPEEDMATLNASQLSQLLTMPSNTRGKFRAKINEIIAKEKQAEMLGDDSVDAVLDCSIGHDEIDFVMDQQDAIIAQATKALKLCDDDARYDKTKMRMEVERIILKANTTKDIIETHHKFGRCEDPEDKSGFVRISNFKIRLKKLKEPPNTRSHFVCILHCGKTLYCSNLIQSKRHRKLKLPDTYHFRGLPSDFKIGLRVYVVHSRARKKCLDLIKNFGMLLKTLLFRSTSKSTRECPANRFFELCGEFTITRNRLRPKECLLKSTSLRSHLTGELKYDIQSGVDLEYFISNYLFICIDGASGVWKRKWCELKGSQMNFFDNRDNDAADMVVDLSRSLSPRIEYSDACIGSRDKSLQLKMKAESHSTDMSPEYIYISCEDEVILSEWKVMINIVLYNLNNWGYI